MGSIIKLGNVFGIIFFLYLFFSPTTGLKNWNNMILVRVHLVLRRFSISVAWDCTVRFNSAVACAYKMHFHEIGRLWTVQRAIQTASVPMNSGFPSFKAAAFLRELVNLKFCFEFEMVHHTWNVCRLSAASVLGGKYLIRAAWVSSSKIARATETFHLRFMGCSTFAVLWIDSKVILKTHLYVEEALKYFLVLLRN